MLATPSASPRQSTHLSAPSFSISRHDLYIIAANCFNNKTVTHVRSGMHLTNIYNLCKQDPSVLKNTTLQAAQCVANTGLGNNHTCIICPNTDLAGVGVRAAFYAQSLFNSELYRYLQRIASFMSIPTALLVLFSPGDSIPSAWAGSLLTAALVIAAFVQKHQATISLHHATLILK